MPKTPPDNDPIAETIVIPEVVEATTELDNPDAQPSEPAEWAHTYESTNTLDEPEPVSLEGFVGIGVEHMSNAEGQWLVDPVTGYITGPA